MEQFDTDDKLLEDKKDKNGNTKYLLIGVMCTIVIVACIILFKYINGPAGAPAALVLYGSDDTPFAQVELARKLRLRVDGGRLDGRIRPNPLGHALRGRCRPGDRGAREGERERKGTRKSTHEPLVLHMVSLSDVRKPNGGAWARSVVFRPEQYTPHHPALMYIFS